MGDRGEEEAIARGAEARAAALSESELLHAADRGRRRKGAAIERAGVKDKIAFAENHVQPPVWGGGGLRLGGAAELVWDDFQRGGVSAGQQQARGEE
jgi:hypothetical protein